MNKKENNLLTAIKMFKSSWYSDIMSLLTLNKNT